MPGSSNRLLAAAGTAGALILKPDDAANMEAAGLSRDSGDEPVDLTRHTITQPSFPPVLSTATSKQTQ